MVPIFLNKILQDWDTSHLVECFPSMPNLGVQSLALDMPDVVVDTHSTSTWEMEAWASEAKVHPQLNNEFEASYMRLY